MLQRLCLAAHALSECDSVPKLYGLGKKSVCSLQQKNLFRAYSKPLLGVTIAPNLVP